ncbi:MAG: hypothetical protein QF828_11290 [Pseudomonadales bacterium]|jgi:hypothetical protein|nr:hypothetical protein [Pseudomonadales bacterium]|tara:strand:+ start:74 stop:349 length:276 start_codon:yes stop_codon:yes gene_type:complete
MPIDSSGSTDGSLPKAGTTTNSDFVSHRSKMDSQQAMNEGGDELALSHHSRIGEVQIGEGVFGLRRRSPMPEFAAWQWALCVELIRPPGCG